VQPPHNNIIHFRTGIDLWAVTIVALKALPEVVKVMAIAALTAATG
jgi:hypothetical protein